MAVVTDVGQRRDRHLAARSAPGLRRPRRARHADLVRAAHPRLRRRRCGSTGRVQVGHPRRRATRPSSATRRSAKATTRSPASWTPARSCPTASPRTGRSTSASKTPTPRSPRSSSSAARSLMPRGGHAVRTSRPGRRPDRGLVQARRRPDAVAPGPDRTLSGGRPAADHLVGGTVVVEVAAHEHDLGHRPSGGDRRARQVAARPGPEAGEREVPVERARSRRITDVGSDGGDGGRQPFESGDRARPMRSGRVAAPRDRAWPWRRAAWRRRGRRARRLLRPHRRIGA